MSTKTIYSVSFKAYLNYYEDEAANTYGALRFYGDIPGPEAEFELVPADPNSGVRIKSIFKQKFLTELSNGWLTPQADENEGHVFVVNSEEDSEGYSQFKDVTLNKCVIAGDDSTGIIRFYASEDTMTPQGKMVISDYQPEETTSEVKENE